MKAFEALPLDSLQALHEAIGQEIIRRQKENAKAEPLLSSASNGRVWDLMVQILNQNPRMAREEVAKKINETLGTSTNERSLNSMISKARHAPKRLAQLPEEIRLPQNPGSNAARTVSATSLRSEEIIPNAVGIGRCQIDLINEGYNNTNVLKLTQERYPNRATMNTVAFYRKHVNNVRRARGLPPLTSNDGK